MNRTTLLERKRISVFDFRCTAEPGEKPFAEQFACHSISYVRKGSFGCHCRGRFHELVAGSVLVGAPGDEYIRTPHPRLRAQGLVGFLTPVRVRMTCAVCPALRHAGAPPLPPPLVVRE